MGEIRVCPACRNERGFHNKIPQGRKGDYVVRFFLLAGLSLALITGLPGICLAGNDGFQVTKQPELQQIRPKKPVKIRLKRSAKDGYSWELSGDDPDEIVRTDRKLKKQLNIP